MIDKKTIARVWKEDKEGDKKVVVPPVDVDLHPPSDRIAIERGAQEPARHKHHRTVLLRRASKCQLELALADGQQPHLHSRICGYSR